MNKELYVSSTPHETKVALVEDDQLAEVFFERENEYTLAGSIYKGRVTRVLPGMQSAFVDIGLERDAFLYVSDFLELTDEDEEDDFGEIPAPRGAIELGKPQPVQQAQPVEAPPGITEPESDEEAETLTEDFAASVDEQSEVQAEPAAVEDRADAGGARRWRGRRRRGRHTRGYEREGVTEPASEAAPAEEPESRAESRPRTEYGPPAGYTPIILPGESISKYRNLSVPTTESQAENGTETKENVPVPLEDFTPLEANQSGNETSEDGPAISEALAEEAVHLDQGYSVSLSEEPEAPSAEEPRRGGKGRWWRSRRKSSAAKVSQKEAAPTLEDQSIEAATDSQAPLPSEAAVSESAPEQPAEEVASQHAVSGPGFSRLEEPGSSSPSGEPQEQSFQEAGAQSDQFESQMLTEAPSLADAPSEKEVDMPAGSYNLSNPQQFAPSSAPKGRTLEHEMLDEEEAELPPVPDDESAAREVAGDEEMVLEEETLDAGNSYSDRWIPKIEDVDEDEVVAAEMRGEKIYETEEEEEEENGSGEQEVADRAEVRASAPTAGYQQRTAQHPGYERRSYRDRGRRGGPRRSFRSRAGGYRHQPLITDLLKEGQEVLVQIAKEPIGKKGARITSHIALPGRFLVYMPTVNHVGVSRKISSDEERQRLKRIVTSERENGLGGFIVRTAAVNIKEEDLRADIRFLKHLWSEIKNRAESSKSPALIYHDLNLVERVLRDHVNADFSQIWVDTEDEYERVIRFANRFQPSLVRRIKLYTKDTPLFEQFGIQDEINRSLKSKVWLKSGGHIVINQTEALVAIDVNTGKYVGKTQRLEDTIVKTNVDAIKEIVRQIRLRDLGGIIVIDFIDMDERKNRQRVMQALEEALRFDRAPSKVLQFNDFGLVAITRKRVKQSLERTLGEPCPYCTGAGFVKSVTTVCNELYTEMRKMAKIHDKGDITVRVNPEVAKALKANNGRLLTELEDLTGKTVLVKSDPTLHQENFDIH
ncbi:MAG TPA: Rne/Rng family ribonuclease [Terriglobales bacterium]|nr:Rne/Rng family ribonuclease [Terriglobales bacterium]